MIFRGFLGAGSHSRTNEDLEPWKLCDASTLQEGQADLEMGVQVAGVRRRENIPFDHTLKKERQSFTEATSSHSSLPTERARGGNRPFDMGYVAAMVATLRNHNTHSFFLWGPRRARISSSSLLGSHFRGGRLSPRKKAMRVAGGGSEDRPPV